MRKGKTKTEKKTLTPKNIQDEIPAELYDTTTSRFSDAALFQRSADGSPRTTFPWRTTLVALALFLLGISFLLTGILHFWDYDRDTSIAFITVGSIAFLPSCYAAFNIIQWYRGVPGFHASQCKCLYASLP